jgi:transposase
MNKKAQQDFTRKLRVLNHVTKTGNVSKICRYFGISRDILSMKKAYTTLGESRLINSKPCSENPKLRTPKSIEEKILYLRTTYYFGLFKISWYLERFHDIKISRSDCYFVLQRHGLNRFLRIAGTAPCPNSSGMRKRCRATPFKSRSHACFLRMNKDIGSNASNTLRSMTPPVSER